MAVTTRPSGAALPHQRMRLTLEEFRALPEGPPFYEFERGELNLANLLGVSVPREGAEEET